jgi:hypothetical protein
MGVAILCAAPISLHQSQDKGLSLSLETADARVGRPATATSVAGVNRRATAGGATLRSGRLQLLLRNFIEGWSSDADQRCPLTGRYRLMSGQDTQCEFVAF